jgi:riboflavin kinase/FMN adenylyltransferase
MRIFETVDIPERFPNPVITIGNYDGIHIGHRQIIERVKAHAARLGGTSMLMTFNPHPLHLLRPDKELAAIVPLEEKKRLIAATGIDVLLVLPFTREFSLLAPEAFVSSLLVEKLGVKGVVIGYDFKFGSRGKGDIPMLETLGRSGGFFVEVVEAITLEGEKIGSNRVRRLVSEGSVTKAAGLLGRPYAIEGTVVRGAQRGATIGYPTINLATDYSLIPANGVYVTEVEVHGRRHGAVTNIGYDPTFTDARVRTIETFILDFDGTLYGERVRLRFCKRLRDEIKFSSVDELKARIALDVETARGYLAAAQ